MRAIRILTVLIAVLAVGALSASAALANPEWELGGTLLKGIVAAESEGTIALENKTEEYVIQCKVRRKVELGNVLGLGVINSITNTAGAKLMKCETKVSSDCETEAEVEALHLPWGTELTGSAGSEARNRILSKSSEEPEWKITCREFGVKTTNWCSAVTSAGTKNEAAGVLESYDAKSAHGVCTNDGGTPLVTTGEEFLASNAGTIGVS